MKLPRLLLFVLLVLVSPGTVAGMQFKTLVFADAADRYHAGNVSQARAALESLSRLHFFELVWVDSAEAFARQTYADFDVIAFISAHPCDLDEVKRAELQAFVSNGGGIVGVHFTFALKEAEHQWPWWEKLIGRVFVCHPPQQSGIMTVTDPEFPACLHLPTKWLWTDEWYTFATPFPKHLNVVLTVDESTYYPRQEDVMGEFHPIAWYHEPEGGRVFYTALGHITESYKDAAFLQHIYGGLLWAAGERQPKW